MNRTKKVLAVGGAIAALGAGGAAIAGAVGAGDDGDEQATGPGAAKARQAALAITGGTANGVERDGEAGATWEVEVTKPDGRTVDVRLDERYELVVIEGDEESESGESESGESESGESESGESESGESESGESESGESE